jgi:hypothetical protein
MMRTICSIAAAAMFAITASAHASEPVKLSDAALDQVTAGAILGISFTQGAGLFFQGGNAGGTLLEQATSQLTGSNGSLRVTTFASVNGQARGQFSLAQGLATSIVCAGVCNFPPVNGNNPT